MSFFEPTPFDKQIGFDIHDYIWQQVINQQEANKYCGTNIDQAMCDYLNPFKSSKNELEVLSDYYESLEYEHYNPELINENNQEYKDEEEYHRDMEEQENKYSSDSDDDDDHYDSLD